MRIFLCDSNFFISIKNAGFLIHTLDHLKHAKEYYSFYTSPQILNELRTFSRKNIENIKEVFETISVDNSAIAILRRGLGPHPPQTADLSLVVAAKKLISDHEIVIISDDYKLGKTVKSILPLADVWPSSVFTLFLSNTLEKSEARNFFKGLWQTVMSSELVYALSRPDAYSPETKISWLISQATEVAGVEIDRKPARRVINDDMSLAIAKYLRGDPLQSMEKTLIEKVKPYIEPLQAALPLIEGLRQMVAQGTTEGIEDQIHLLLQGLQSELEIGLIALSEIPSAQLLETYMDYIASLEFLAGVCSLSRGKLNQTISNFSSGSFDSLISGSDQQALHMRFLSAMVAMLAKKYSEAAESYKKASRLAKHIENTDLKLKADVGEAVSLFLSDRVNIAKKVLEITREDSKEDPSTNAAILNEFGDQLYNLGLSNIALHLYNQSFENALLAKNLSWVREGLADLTKCYFTMGRDLNELYDRFQKGMELVERSNHKTQKAILETMRNTLDDMQLPPEREFPMGRTVKFDELPSVLRGWMNVSHCETKGKTTIIVCFLPGTGNIGIVYPGKELSIRIPESTRVKILPFAEVRFTLRTIPIKKKMNVRLFLELNKAGTLDLHSSIYENFATRLL